MDKQTAYTLIQAKRNLQNAQEQEKRLQIEAENKALEELFKPVLEFWDLIKDLPAKSYRPHDNTVAPLSRHRADREDQSSIYLPFWNHCGNYGLCVKAAKAKEGHYQLYTGYGQDALQSPKPITQQEAIDILIEYAINQNVALPE